MRAAASLIVAALLLLPAGAGAADIPPIPADNRIPAGLAFKDDLNGQLNAFFAAVQGEYRGRWPGAFAKRPDLDTIPAWAVFRRIDLPAFSSHVLYQEVREDGPEGRIVRQRIMAFADAPDRSHNYATFTPIMDPVPYARADLHPDRIAGLKPSDFFFFGRGRQMNMIGQPGGFRILTAPTSCVIPYPDGKSRYTGMEMRFDGKSVGFQEAAYGMDGAFLAGKLEMVTMERVAP